MADGGGGEAAAIIVASTTGIGVLGKGLAWLFSLRRGRIGQLEQRLEALAKAQLDQTRRTDCVVSIAIVLIDEVRATNPASRALHQVRSIIGDQYPDLLRRFFPIEVHAETPVELRDWLDRAQAALDQNKRN